MPEYGLLPVVGQVRAAGAVVLAPRDHTAALRHLAAVQTPPANQVKAAFIHAAAGAIHERPRGRQLFAAMKLRTTG